MTDIPNLRALLAAATPLASWQSHVWYGADNGGWAATGPHHVATEEEDTDEPGSPAHGRAAADAALIATAVNALEPLLDELEASREHARTCVELCSDEQMTRPRSKPVPGPGAHLDAGAPARVVHWIGGATTATIEWLQGWPCCCCGKRAHAIVDTGNVTRLPWDVTCKGCLRTMRAAGISTEDTRVHLLCARCQRRHHILAERCEECGGKLRQAGGVR